MGNEENKNNNIIPLIGLSKYIYRDLSEAIQAILRFMCLGNIAFEYCPDSKKIKKDMPNELRCGIYLFVDSFMQITYVGMSDDMSRRVKEHKRDSAVILINIFDKAVAKRLETVLIALINPHGNTITTLHGVKSHRKTY